MLAPISKTVSPGLMCFFACANIVFVNMPIKFFLRVAMGYLENTATFFTIEVNGNKYFGVAAWIYELHNFVILIGNAIAQIRWKGFIVGIMLAVKPFLSRWQNKPGL